MPFSSCLLPLYQNRSTYETVHNCSAFDAGRGKRGNPIRSVVINRPMRRPGLGCRAFFPAHLAPVACCCFEFNLINSVVNEKWLQSVKCYYVGFGFIKMIRNRTRLQTFYLFYLLFRTYARLARCS